MKSAKWILAFALICSAISFFPLVSHACSCVNNPVPITAMDNAEAVFVGKVLKVKQERKQKGIIGAIEYRDVNLFEVEKTWKGIEQSQIMIYDNGHDESCGFVFEEGKSYIIYAYKSKDGDLYTSYCSRTAELSNANADLEQLGKGKVVDKKVNLEGKMKWISKKDYDLEILIGGIIVLLTTAFIIVNKVRRKK